jgi:serine/threonine protein kinase
MDPLDSFFEFKVKRTLRNFIEYNSPLVNESHKLREMDFSKPMENGLSFAHNLALLQLELIADFREDACRSTAIARYSKKCDRYNTASNMLRDFFITAIAKEKPFGAALWAAECADDKTVASAAMTMLDAFGDLPQVRDVIAATKKKDSYDVDAWNQTLLMHAILLREWELVRWIFNNSSFLGVQVKQKTTGFTAPDMAYGTPVEKLVSGRSKDYDALVKKLPLTMRLHKDAAFRAAREAFKGFRKNHGRKSGIFSCASVMPGVITTDMLPPSHHPDLEAVPAKPATPGSSRFTKISKLGQGGYGEVWSVKEEATGKMFAAKYFLKKIDWNEINILFSLMHPNILHGVQIFEDGDKLCVILPLAQGDMDKAWTAGTDDGIVADMHKLLSALAVLHEYGNYHCDIKPQNILVVDGELKMADFGLSFPLVGPQMQTCGTPTFMAPQVNRDVKKVMQEMEDDGQYRGTVPLVGNYSRRIPVRDINETANLVAADIYSMGMVFLWMLQQKNYFLINGLIHGPESLLEVMANALATVKNTRNIKGEFKQLLLLMVDPQQKNRAKSVDQLLSLPLFAKRGLSKVIGGKVLVGNTKNLNVDKPLLTHVANLCELANFSAVTIGLAATIILRSKRDPNSKLEHWAALYLAASLTPDGLSSSLPIFSPAEPVRERMTAIAVGLDGILVAPSIATLGADKTETLWWVRAVADGKYGITMDDLKRARADYAKIGSQPQPTPQPAVKDEPQPAVKDEPQPQPAVKDEPQPQPAVKDEPQPVVKKEPQIIAESVRAPAGTPYVRLGGHDITSFSGSVGFSILEPTEAFRQQQAKYGLNAPVSIIFADLHGSKSNLCDDCACSQAGCCVTAYGDYWFALLNKIASKQEPIYVFNENPITFATEKEILEDQKSLDIGSKKFELIWAVAETAKNCYKLADRAKCEFPNIMFNQADPRTAWNFLRSPLSNLIRYASSQYEIVRKQGPQTLEELKAKWKPFIPRYHFESTLCSLTSPMSEIEVKALLLSCWMSPEVMATTLEVITWLFDWFTAEPDFSSYNKFWIANKGGVVHKEITKCKGELQNPQWWVDLAAKSQTYAEIANSYLYQSQVTRRAYLSFTKGVLEILRKPPQTLTEFVDLKVQTPTIAAFFIKPNALMLDLYMLARSFKTVEAGTNPKLAVSYCGAAHAENQRSMLTAAGLYVDRLTEINPTKGVDEDTAILCNKVTETVDIDEILRK